MYYDWGEIYAITWDDIDFENKTLSVNRQVQWYQEKRDSEEIKRNNGTKDSNAGFGYFSEPKYNSYRVIDIDTVLLDALQKEKQKQERAKLYYDEYYVRYYCNEKISFQGKAPNYIIPPINKIQNIM